MVPPRRRRDTWPLINALKEAGCTAEVACYSAATAAKLVEHAAAAGGAVVSRVEESEVAGDARDAYLSLLEKLEGKGLKLFPTAAALRAAWELPPAPDAAAAVAAALA